MKIINEAGRSMVEMLGVLAIIGVLSIGGIAGYTRAMRTWRANDILDAANKVIVVAETTEEQTATYSDVSTHLDQVAGGVVSSIEVNAAQKTVTITLAGRTSEYTKLKETIEASIAKAGENAETHEAVTLHRLGGFDVTVELPAAPAGY